MRICFLSVGAFAHIGPYLDHFEAAGHDVRFLALAPGPRRSVPTYDLGFGSRYAGGSGKWKYPISMLRARALVRRLAPDIVHAHYATSGGLAGLICDFHPTIVTAHGTDLTAGAASRVWRGLLRAVFSHADCVNPVSDGLAELAVGLGVDSSKIRVLTPGIDVERFSRPRPAAAEGDGRLRLVCTRRLDPECDPQTVILGLSRLKARGLRFRATLAGGGSLRPRMEALAARLGLAEEVSFVGGVSQARMPELLGSHDVYLSASRWDGTSLSLLEAMATGLFPIVSRIRANASWLEEGVGGLFHRVGDPEDLAERVLEYARRPELGARAARANRVRVLERGDRRANMARLEAIYRELTLPTVSPKKLHGRYRAGRRSRLSWR